MHFLLYWLPAIADERLAAGYVLDHLGSSQLRRAAAGDTVWLVTARKGRLSLIGRLQIGAVVTPAEARRTLGPDAEWWPSPKQALAKAGTAEPLRDVPLQLGQVAALRFESTARDRLDVADGRVFPQQLQTMRRLAPRSAELLRRTWEARVPRR